MKSARRHHQTAQPLQTTGPPRLALQLPSGKLNFTVSFEVTIENGCPKVHPIVTGPEFRPAPQDTSGINPPTHQGMNPPGPRFALRKHYHCWELIFGGQLALLQDESAVYYISRLATHPHQPINGYDLYAHFNPADPQNAGSTEQNSSSLSPAVPAGSPRLQEGNPSKGVNVPHEAAIRQLLCEIAELEAATESDSVCALEKQEAEAELREKRKVLAVLTARSKDAAHQAVRAVRLAINRLYKDLRFANDEHGNPHPVLRPFAEHLLRHLILPSRALPAQLIYQPPPGVLWET